MEKRKDRLIGLSCNIIFCLIIFSGCATKETVKSPNDEEVLRERVTAYWNHKINGEFDKSYEYESPLYRKQVNLISYIRSFNPEVLVKWTGMRIEKVFIEDEAATLDLKVKVKILNKPSRDIEPETSVSEKWVRVGGIWYHIPHKVKQ